MTNPDALLDPVPPTQESETLTLFKRLVQDLRRLISTEFQLAQRELSKQARASLVAVAIVGAGGVFSLAGLGMALVAIFVALGETAAAAIGMACVLFAIAFIFGVAGWLMFPRAPLLRTEARIAGDAHQLEHAVAS